MFGIFLVAPRKQRPQRHDGDQPRLLRLGVISLVLVVIAAFVYLPSKFSELKGVTDPTILHHSGNPRLLAIGAVVVGLVLASAIQLLTGYFTETNRKPVMEIGQSSETGAATVILSGISVGLESAVYSALLIGGAVYMRLPARHRQRHDRPVRGRAGRHRPADHGRRHRLDGHLRPGLRQRPGHRRDVRRGRRRGGPGPDQPGRGRQHHQGHHQGHRDRDRRAGGDRPVRRVPHPGHGRAPAQAPGRLQPGHRRARTTCSASSSAPRWCSSSPAC